MSTAPVDVVDTEPTYPTCPSCGATGRSCRRPTGRTTAEWHAERKALLQAADHALDPDAAADPAEPPREVNPTALEAMRTTSFYLVPVESIDPHPSNPRRAVGDVGDLAESIRSQGILEPLVVGADNGVADTRHVLIAGHRRLAAARVAGLDRVPCIIRTDLDTPAKQLEAMLVENLHRADLTPMEEADAYQALLEFPGFTQASVAREVGQPTSRVRDRLKLTKLPERAKEKVHAGQLTITDALALLEFADNKAATKTLLGALGTDQWRQQLAAAREDLEHDKKLDSRIQRLRGKGITVAKSAPKEDLRIDRSRYYPDAVPLVAQAGVQYNDPDKVDAWVIDHHAQCPGHVTALVVEGYRGRQVVAHFCTQPKLHPSPKGPKRSPQEVKRAKDEAEKRKQIRGDAAIAARLRHDHLHEQLLRHTAAAVQPRMVALVMQRFDSAAAYTAAERAHQLQALAAVFGFELPQPEGRRKLQLGDVRDMVHATVKVLSLPALVFVLDFFDHLRVEASLSNEEPHGGGVHSSGHAWLQILAARYGYIPSDFEAKRFRWDAATATASEAFVEHVGGRSIAHEAGYGGEHLLGLDGAEQCPCAPEISYGHTHDAGED